MQTGPACLPQTPKSDEEPAPSHDAEGVLLPNGASADEIPRPKPTLESIYIYPIKSCAPQRAGAAPRSRGGCFSSAPISLLRGTLNGYPAGSGSENCSGGGRDGGDGVGGEVGSEGGGKCAGWPLGSSGLAYDREWAVVDHRDRALRLKQVCVWCGRRLVNCCATRVCACMLWCRRRFVRVRGTADHYCCTEFVTFFCFGLVATERLDPPVA